jgi:hypothetical protein
VDDAPALAAAAERPVTVERAMRTLTTRYPPLAGYTDRQLARTREDLHLILQFVEASLLTGDDSIITGFTGWLTPVLTTRGLPHDMVPLYIDVLHQSLPEGRNEIARLLTAMKTASAAEQ